MIDENYVAADPEIITETQFYGWLRNLQPT
jgi:hypothetical protein